MNKIIPLFWEDIAQTLRVGLRSTVTKNAASLYAIQFTNYILPLITIPYLVRVLGPAGYGAVAFGQGLIAYFMLLVDYGFDWSATRKISVERSNQKLVNHIVLHTWAAKGLLCIAGLLVLIGLINLVPKMGEVSILLLILYGMAVGNMLFPTWLFQGMERMVAISLINLVVRLFVVLGIFTLVHNSEDYLLYAGLMSAGSIATGLVGMAVAAVMFKLKPIKLSWHGIWKTLVEGWTLFLSRASVSLYTAGNAFILGMLTNHTVVGYYSAAEKLVKSVLGLLGPISQAAYPKFSKLASESKQLALLWGKRMLLLMGGGGLALTLVLFVGAPVIVSILFGSQYTESIAVMRILAPIILLIALSNVLGIQIMLPFGKDRAFTLILLGAGVLNMTLAVFLTPIWEALGMATAVLISELFVTITMLIYLNSKGIPLLIKRVQV